MPTPCKVLVLEEAPSTYFHVRTTSPLSKTSVHLKSGTGGITVILIVAILIPFAGQKSSKAFY